VDISQLYRCNRNLSCRRCYCSAADKTLTIVTAVTTGNTPGKVRNKGKSGICPRKMASLQGVIWHHTCPSLTQSAGKTNKILGGYTTLFSCQTLLSSP